MSDRLSFDFGDVSLKNYASWVDVLVVGRLGEKSAAYQQAKEYEERGVVTILTERQFINAMDDKFTPPESPKNERAGVVYPPNIPDWEEKEKRERTEFMDGKRADYLAKRKPAGNKYDVRLQTEMKLTSRIHRSI